MTFPQFLEKKFLEFQQTQGGRRTVSEFAAFIGVKQSTLSTWLNNINPPQPSGENIRLLADKLGIEIYDVLGLDRPDEDLHYIQRNWNRLPPQFRRSLREQAEKYRLENELSGISDRRRAPSS